MSAPRCSYCDAPLTYCDGKTLVPHLTWCPRVPHEPAERRPLVADDRAEEAT